MDWQTYVQNQAAMGGMPLIISVEENNSPTMVRCTNCLGQVTLWTCDGDFIEPA